MDIVSKINGNTLSATEFNQIPTELENLIANAGLTPSELDTTQVRKAIAQLVADGNFYATSGTATAITLSALNPKSAPTLLRHGLKARFIAGYNNTGAVTVNLNSLGAKPIYLFNEHLGADVLEAGKYYEIVYMQTEDAFELCESSIINELKADVTLNNLNLQGFAKLQYAPFAINEGSRDVTSLGKNRNNTLYYSGNTIYCRPCTYTDCLGQTRIDSATREFTHSVSGSGTFPVVKSMSTGELALTGKIIIGKIAPTNTSYRWLDISTMPANFRYYDGNGWVTNNDIIPIGEVTITSGNITGITNKPFNDNGYSMGNDTICGLVAPNMTEFETLTVGASGTIYTAPANGWFWAGGGSGSLQLGGWATSSAGGGFGPNVSKFCFSGQQISFSYSSAPSAFRFYYARGAKEADYLSLQ